MSPLHYEHLAVRFGAGLSAAARRAVARECFLEPPRPHHDLPGESFALLPIAAGRGSSASRHRRARAALAAHARVTRAATVRRHRGSLLIATDRVWVGIEPGRAGRAALAALRRQGARVLATRDGDRLLRLHPTHDPEAVCARLRGRKGVAYAEPDHVIVGRGLAAGPRRRPGSVQPALRAIAAPVAWKTAPTTRSTRVAVLDCGVLGSHPDLRGTVVAAFDATGRSRPLRPSPWDSHGTECAGLLVATGRARGGIRGVASGSGLLAVRVGFTPSRLADYVSKVSWIAAGIDWAWKHGAGVISMSFGGGARATPIVRALERARTRGRRGLGTLLVAATGNSGQSPIEFPASAAGVIGVAALNRRNRWASFSSWGRGVDLAAPGVAITTTTIPDPSEGEPSLYLTDQGTSLATPIVAGVAALALATDPTLTEAELVGLLTRSARPHGQSRDRVGAGCVDAGAAVAAALGRVTRWSAGR